MKYSVLLTGKNNLIMEDFFTHLWDTFECLSASGRSEDIANHLKYYAPDAIIHCLREENEESIRQIISVRPKLRAAGIPLVVIGSEEDCTLFARYAMDMVSLMLTKPITINAISEKLMKFLDEKREREEYERQLEEERKQEEKRKIEELRKREEEERQQEEKQRKKEEEQRKKEEEINKKAAKRRENGEKGHVLVVDDDPLMLKMIKEHLHEEYDVATAINGKVALKFLEKKTTDLILLDYEMPVENGPMVLEKLRGNDATKDIPVIFLTGITEKKKIQKALVLKPQGYLLKPIDHEKLVKTIKKTIG